MEYATLLRSVAEKHVGSSPSLGTKKKIMNCIICNNEIEKEIQEHSNACKKCLILKIQEILIHESIIAKCFHSKLYEIKSIEGMQN